MTPTDEKTPNPVDLHVGARVRMRRKFIGLSQEGLADKIDLTFQQVQKYERGSNRISCSKLHAIAAALQAPIGYFFEGYGVSDAPTTTVEAETAVAGFLMTTEGLALALDFPRIRSSRLRRRILALVQEMADDAEGLITDDAAATPAALAETRERYLSAAE